MWKDADVVRINEDKSVYFSNVTRTGNSSNTSQTCYCLTHPYVRFTIEASCKYSSLCAAILCNINTGSTFLNHALRFHKKSLAFEKVPRLRPLVLLIIVVLR